MCVPYVARDEFLKKENGGKAFVWVQEEPENQGAWTFVAPRLGQLLPDGKKVSEVLMLLFGVDSSQS